MSKRITYSLRIDLTEPLSDDPDDPDYPTAEAATSQRYRRDVERRILRALRPSEGDRAEVELVAWEVKED